MYNNRNAKHDNTFNQYEVEFIIEQTSIMMQFLIKILGENKKEKIFLIYNLVVYLNY